MSEAAESLVVRSRKHEPLLRAGERATEQRREFVMGWITNVE